MRKHVALALLVAVVLALGLAGCGSSGSSSSGASQQSQGSASSSSAVAISQNPDEEFLPALTAGLKARWELSDKFEGQNLTIQMRKELADAELEQLAAFKGANFKDAELGKLAERYIAAVEDSAACLDSYDTNYLDFTERWSNSYGERTLVIKDLAERYGFKMPDESQKHIDSMIEDAKEVEADQSVPADKRQVAEKDIPTAVASAFKKDGDVYRATYVNPGPISFDTYDLVVCLLNDKGGLVEDHAFHFDSWPAGSEQVFEFTTNSEFANIAAYAERWHGTW